MARQFVAVPQLPKNIPNDMAQFLSAMKENIELLTGTRGHADNHAVTRGDIRTEGAESTDAAELRDRLNSLLQDMKG